ncbi:metallophosphoesterase [Pseudooceanicola sp. 200-1SW]|uniref:metallophosphoesterase n=1 Tax=Pseudooceanicola sp. 200-1SW TaxID=3425949 RepID=UPI003D7F9877
MLFLYVSPVAYVSDVEILYRLRYIDAETAEFQRPFIANEKLHMKYLVLADLHYDFWKQSDRDPFAGLEREIGSLDLLILAGDISNKPTVRWKTALDALKVLLPPERIAVFPGNHDFYQFRIDGEDRLKSIAAAAGVLYANMNDIRLNDTRLLCATLWSDFEIGPGRMINEDHIPRRMNDYKLIRVAGDGYRKLRARDVIQRHLAHRNWLDLELSRKFSGRTIVVTHHAPHPDVLHNYSEDLEAAYASDLTSLIARHAPDAWLFGHSHDACGTTVGSTRLENVSLGYPWEVSDPAERIRSLIRETETVADTE